MTLESTTYPSVLAYSDVLAISVRLQKTLDDVAPAEVHLFAYLSCLLSVYDGHPADNWGYSFVTTTYGYPYSLRVDEALTVLSQKGYITSDLDFFIVTAQGEEEYEFVTSLSQHTRRLPFIGAACASISALPIGLVRNALLEEPNLRSAVALSSSRWLLDEPGVALLHEHFEALREAMEPTNENIVVPAIVWLNYLAEVQQFRNSETHLS